MDGRHPVLVFFAALFSGMAALVAVSIALGLLVTDVLVTGNGGPDNAFVHTLAQHRSGFETDLSAIGSTIGGAPVLPILVGLVAIVAAVLRHWRVAAFAVFVLALESATYRITSLVVPRDRPHVQRLEDLPADASFPSGHTAASIAVYAGLVLLLTSRIRDSRVRIVAWILAVALPVFVALSRMYRGMHHPLDVLGGMVTGIAAIVILVFACRAAGVAAERRAARAATDRDGRFLRSERTTRVSAA
jgi:undecaprenyl-diphosphatase